MMEHSLKKLAQDLRNLRIEHNDYREGRRILQELWDFTQLGINVNAKVIIGQPGTGKTSLAESLLHEHPPIRSITGMQIPVVFVKLPSTPTLKSTLGAILKALHDPLPNKGSIEDRQNRVEVLLEACGTRVIIFDEYQRLLRWGTRRKIEDVFELIKDFIKPDLGVLIAGLPECVDVIKDNGQIKRRLEPSITLRRYRSAIQDDFEQFAGILMSFSELISKYLILPDLSQPKMIYSFYCASGGLIAYISKIFIYAVMEADKKKSTVISLSDLAYARTNVVFEQDLWKPYGEPFSETFDIKNIPNYEHIAMQISSDVEIPTMPKKIRKETLSEMMSL